MHNDCVRCSLDVMYYEIVVFFINNRFEEIFNGKTIGHKFGGSEHKTSRYDNVEKSIDHHGHVIVHVEGKETSQ